MVRRVVETEGACHEDGAEDTVGVSGGEAEQVAGPDGDADGDGCICTDCIEDGDGILDRLQRGVRSDVAGSVAATVAPRVEGHDPEVPGEVGDLPLPEP